MLGAGSKAEANTRDTPSSTNGGAKEAEKKNMAWDALHDPASSAHVSTLKVEVGGGKK